MLSSFFVRDTEFIEKLYSQHKHDVYSYAFSYCKSKSDAEDCLQEVFCRALEKVNKLKKHPAPEKWLFVTARLASLEKLRSNNKKLKLEFNIDDIELALQDDSFEDRLLETEYSDGEILLLRNEIVDSLTDKDKELYTLRYVDKLDINTISTHLKISYSNVTTRLNRLKKKIIRFVSENFCD